MGWGWMRWGGIGWGGVDWRESSKKGSKERVPFVLLFFEGTEYHIGMVGNIRVGNVIPGFRDPSAEQLQWVRTHLCGEQVADDAAALNAAMHVPAGADVDDDLDPGVEQEPDGADTEVSLAGLLNPPPMNHIVHNATDGLRGTLQHYKEYVRGATVICKILKKRQHRTKVLERMFGRTQLLRAFGARLGVFLRLGARGAVGDLGVLYSRAAASGEIFASWMEHLVHSWRACLRVRSVAKRA